jgi:hypothetical protein
MEHIDSKAPAAGAADQLTSSDLAAAGRFADACYDSSVLMPNRSAMERLAAAGVVIRLESGAWAETPRLRQLGF